ncbi:hypothetical protein LPJ61_001603 [Coemansia biformis]|uniref:Uncharacterized protein n=1 Tax=Coemansia biformis TaxID=1286918 RepID=A0A9W8D0G0_9FUNG|nr:hypothetical protein LPJ61_001603 [Coemansia biformis]
MALQKSFLDSTAVDMSWLGTQLPCFQSADSSQSETLLDNRSQAFGSMDCAQPRMLLPAAAPDDSHRLHQDHKAIKRAVDKGARDSAVSLSSLHEKASKINLGISDLHADLKKLERVAALDGSHPHAGVVDMEIKLGNLVRGLESKIMSSISGHVAAAVDSKLKDALRHIDDQLAKHASSLAGAGNRSDDGITGKLAELSAAAAEILAAVMVLGPAATHHASMPLLQMTPAPAPGGGRQLLAPPCNMFGASSLPLAAARKLPPPSPAGDGNGEAAGSCCISFGFKIAECRTACGASFSVADAMGRADSQRPHAAVARGPPATPQGKRAKRLRP